MCKSLKINLKTSILPHWSKDTIISVSRKRLNQEGWSTILYISSHRLKVLNSLGEPMRLWSFQRNCNRCLHQGRWINLNHQRRWRDFSLSLRLGWWSLALSKSMRAMLRRARCGKTSKLTLKTHTGVHNLALTEISYRSPLMLTQVVVGVVSYYSDASGMLMKPSSRPHLLAIST